MGDDEMQKWHVKKEVSVGHILTTILLFFSGVWAVAAMDTRIAVLENEQENTGDSLNRIENKVERVLDKLDEKADKE